MPKLQSSDEELSQRMNFVDKMRNNLVLKTGNEEIDLEYYFSKIRACESIVKNKCGYLHSPGGGCYYAAIWTNDVLGI